MKTRLIAITVLFGILTACAKSSPLPQCSPLIVVGKLIVEGNLIVPPCGIIIGEANAHTDAYNKAPTKGAP